VKKDVCISTLLPWLTYHSSFGNFDISIILCSLKTLPIHLLLLANSICMSLFTFSANGVVTTTIRLQFDCDSTARRPFDDYTL